MAIERRIKAVGPLALALNGGANGLVTVSDTKGFRVKSQVVLQGTGLPNLTLEIKRVLSKTQFYVGEKGNILQREDISQYTLAAGSTVHQPEQDRPGVPIDQHERAVYEEEPVLAKRVILVDEYGEFYDTANPLKVQLSDGSIEIGTVNAEVEVQLSHKDNSPNPGDVADSVRVGDGVDELAINPDGSINVVSGGISNPFVQNLNIVTAGTEYSLNIPTTTKKFYFKNRGMGKVQVSFTVGQSNTTFFTLYPGVVYSEENLVLLTPINIYFRSTKANETIELIRWE